MQTRNLIINADDCNLTSGVTRAILDCHANGIVSSTSWLINLPSKISEIKAVRDSGLGIGLHLNVSLGAPVAKAERIPSLVTKEGLFRKKLDYENENPGAADLVTEYKCQMALFEKKFGCLPTHLDTHHQLHDQSVFMQALAMVASETKRPIRRSALMDRASFSFDYPAMISTEKLFGDLDAKVYWTAEKLRNVFGTVWSGTAELMCHPGIVDADLRQKSSMTVTREKEHALFSSLDLKKELERFNIRLINFSQI